jgi:hypothetical protein
MDYSYIIASDSCTGCRGKVDSKHRRVLRTPRQDICVNCGAVTNDFGGFRINSFDLTDDVIPIPAPASDVLEYLLRTRSFSLSREEWQSHDDWIGSAPPLTEGTNPHFMSASELRTPHAEAQAQPPAHRVGGVTRIFLVGGGNSEAVIRFSQSDANLYKAPSTGTFVGDESVMPTRVRRAGDHLSRTFGFHGLHRGKTRYHQSLRFQQSFQSDELHNRTLQLCLVVGVELSWIKIGRTFPRDTGPRRYRTNSGCRLLTFEEMVDRMMVRELTASDANGNLFFQKGSKDEWYLRTIIDYRDINFPLVPLVLLTPEEPTLQIHNEGCGYARTWGAVPNNGWRLLPCNANFEVFFLAKGLHHLPVEITASADGNELTIEQRDAGWTQPTVPANARPPQVTAKSARGLWVSAPSKPCVWRLSVRNGSDEAATPVHFEFLVVSYEDYERAWEEYSEQILEETKLKLLQEFYSGGYEHLHGRMKNGYCAAYNRLQVKANPDNAARKSPSFAADQPVAVPYYGDVYIEAKHSRTLWCNGQLLGYRVKVNMPDGIHEWMACDIVDLTDALMNGVTVLPSCQANGRLSATTQFVRPWESDSAPVDLSSMRHTKAAV